MQCGKAGLDGWAAARIAAVVERRDFTQASLNKEPSWRTRLQ
jgi:hypothetical protein